MHQIPRLSSSWSNSPDAKGGCTSGLDRGRAFDRAGVLAYADKCLGLGGAGVATGGGVPSPFQMNRCMAEGFQAVGSTIEFFFIFLRDAHQRPRKQIGGAIAQIAQWLHVELLELELEPNSTPPTSMKESQRGPQRPLRIYLMGVGWGRMHGHSGHTGQKPQKQTGQNEPRAWPLETKCRWWLVMKRNAQTLEAKQNPPPTHPPTLSRIPKRS